MEFVKIGEICNTHGIKGELKIISFSDFENERYKKDSFVYIGEDKIKEIVKGYRHHNGFTLLTLKDKEDINLVLKYKGKNIYSSIDDVKPLSNGKYYFKDLIGLDIKVNGKTVGKCIDVESGISSNYLRVELSNKQLKLIPYVYGPIVKEVNLKDLFIEIIDMEGLL